MYLDSTQTLESFGVNNPVNFPFYEMDEEDQENLMDLIHANRRFDDTEFFSGQIASWADWVEAVKGFFGGHVTYKTKKLDTEPDEFYFNVGGYSGKFSFNADETADFPNLRSGHYLRKS
ncbi:MAG: hypothetical protein IPJ00_11000 [Saprospirales bacterium]|nr:hypothetical protein [Saprospirales bacterium]